MGGELISQGTVILAVLSINANLKPYAPGKCSLNDGVYLMQGLGLDMGYTGFNNYYGCGPHHKGLDSEVERWVEEAIRYNGDLPQIRITDSFRGIIPAFKNLVSVPERLEMAEGVWARILARVMFLRGEGFSAEQIKRRFNSYPDHFELAQNRLSEFGLI